MSRPRACAGVCATLLVCTSAYGAAAKEVEPSELRLGTSEDLEPLVRAWMDAYSAKARTARPQLRSPRGASASALDWMLGGEIDAAIVGRPLRDGETAAFAARFAGPPVCLAVATPAPRGQQRATLGVLVHRTNPLRSVSLTQIDAIFSAHRRRGASPVSSWMDLGLDGSWAKAPLRPVAPETESGTSQYFRESVLWGAGYRPDVREVPRLSDAVVRAVAADPLAIGITTLNFGTRGTKVLAVSDAGAAFTPTDEHVGSHRYPLTRWTDLCIDPSQATPPERVVDFARFVLGERGQRIAAAQGFLPLAQQTIESSLAKVAPQPPLLGRGFTLPAPDLQLAWMPPGELLLGSPLEEPSRGVDEGPQTRVSLVRGFWIGRTEVTQSQWRAVMGANPSRFVAPTHPVEQVSWRQASEFARRIDARERAAGRIPSGYVYALPAEAQWEYAAKAGSTGAFSMNVDEVAWHDQNSGGSTRPVGSKRPNAWGLHDMLGNVWEWCSDWYAPYPGGTAPEHAGPSSGFAKASRGGSWWAGPRGARPANRYRDMPQNGNDDLGFRLALVPGGSQPPDRSSQRSRTRN